MIEVKPASEISDPIIQVKKQTAEMYCKKVSENIGQFGIVKRWRYVIIPTERITVHSTVEGLLSER